VIGPVAALDLAWWERRRLFGRRVVVTRARDQASELTERLRAEGADVVEVPTIAIEDPADAAALRAATSRLAGGHYDWVVFTSANAVHRLMAGLRDARALGRTQVAAVGSATAKALAAHGLVADLVPERFVAEALVDVMPAPPASGRRVLVPRAAAGRDVLPDGLRAAGWEVDLVEAYRTVPAATTAHDVDRLRHADAITFTSSSTVTNFLASVGAGLVPAVVACIGPVTADTARAAGLSVTVVAAASTVDGLVEALVGAFEPVAERS
jgi:uroporphyrinogen III methyltransferase/synthase